VHRQKALRRDGVMAAFGHAAVLHNKANNRRRILIREYRNNWTAIRNHGNCAVMIMGSTHTLLPSTID
jgi:hypothetical protein